MLFYDRVLDLYINDKPLLISSKVQQAAFKVGVSLRWNSNGYVRGVSSDEVKLLSQELGLVMLSVQDFMHLAQREPRVASNEFAEWLSDSFFLSPHGRMLDSGERELEIPASRPGWFDINNIADSGLPSDISPTPTAGKWKFWSLEDPGFKSTAVRGFVTSSGTCSLDLGIPHYARHPGLMIRECYRKKPYVNKHPLDRIWVEYEAVTLLRHDDEIRDFFRGLDLDKIISSADQDEFLATRNNERLCDLKGKQRLSLGDYDGLRVVSFATIANTLSEVPSSNTIYVTGHKHPDADAVVSSVFEAARKSIAQKTSCVAWVERVPYVVRQLLGQKICDDLCRMPKFGRTHDVVLVDCHTLDEGHDYQVKSVIDHHIISSTYPYFVAVSQEVSWSSTIQVYVKFLGSGLDLDQPSAKILLEATLLEAEPQLVKKMSRLDNLAFHRLITLAGESRGYPELMEMLIGDPDTTDRFMEDYKQTLYGFAVIKAKAITCFKARAEANNVEKRLPLTVVKQVAYNPSFDGVARETIGLYFNEDFYDKGFRAAIQLAVQKACEAFHGIDHVVANGNQVDVTNVAHQTPRLLLGPLLESIVAEHLRFFYSDRIGMYISCGFYNHNTGPNFSGADKPTCAISFYDVQELLHGTSTSFLSLQQYWELYEECTALGDAVMLKSLRDKKYVELLDTIVRASDTRDYKYLISVCSKYD
ncbi:hypothetical protein SAMD00023353_7600010 [Rosellinia necatrix]|uniref:DDH domain-containing protein n=1 Tax=Rosellinia necatrix TaxID=77044 RepID=A0A1W2TUJ4_ROSNE|nr:hypothetical protein SAMD00023353_7600010 [Rosellinia necatrix]